MTLPPLPSSKTLDYYFLEARSKLLDLAAILDRIDRGGEAEGFADNPRVLRIRQAIDVLAEAGDDRAEQIQLIFSLPYDPDWKRPMPR